jgi:hypothetical protein
VPGGTETIEKGPRRSPAKQRAERDREQTEEIETKSHWRREEIESKPARSRANRGDRDQETLAARGDREQRAGVLKGNQEPPSAGGARGEAEMPRSRSGGAGGATEKGREPPVSTWWCESTSRTTKNLWWRGKKCRSKKSESHQRRPGGTRVEIDGAR